MAHFVFKCNKEDYLSFWHAYISYVDVQSSVCMFVVNLFTTRALWRHAKCYAGIYHACIGSQSDLLVIYHPRCISITGWSSVLTTEKNTPIHMQWEILCIPTSAQVGQVTASIPAAVLNKILDTDVSRCHASLKNTQREPQLRIPAHHVLYWSMLGRIMNSC